jgi:signal transduction histidine kinase
MFTQVKPGLDRSKAGLGIGLSVAKRLVDLHQGEIIARSNGPGTGSEFEVRLPIVSVEGEPPRGLAATKDDETTADG